MTDATFSQTVNTLTTQHHEWVDRDTGKQLLAQNGLLQQLREAVFGGMGGTGGSQFGSKLPLDSAALDLLEEITVQATEALAQVNSRPTPYGHAEDYVTEWANLTDEHKIFTVSVRRTAEPNPDEPLKPLVYDHLTEMSARQLVDTWATRIEEYFDPPSTRQINAPCPHCGTEFIYRQQDGHTVKTTALNFIRDKITGRTIEARCSADNCARTWPPEKFGWLASAIGAKPIEGALKNIH